MNNYRRVMVAGLKLGDRVLEFDSRTKDDLGWATVVKLTPKGETRKVTRDGQTFVELVKVNWIEVEMRSKSPEVERETWEPTREVMVML